MQVFRLVRAKFAKPLSGKGAALKGGRWNSPGIEMIYAAENRSLAMAEVAVHFSLATMPSDYVMTTIDIPDGVKRVRIKESDLPSNWKDFPHPPATQKVGDAFVNDQKAAVVFIPSVVTQGDYNVLINPLHKDFAKIKIVKVEKFPFDHRLWK